MALKFNEEAIRTQFKTNITNSKNYLNSASQDLLMDVPEDFYYYIQLKNNIPNKLNEIINNVNSIEKKIEEQISAFENVEKKNKEVTDNLSTFTVSSTIESISYSTFAALPTSSPTKPPKTSKSTSVAPPAPGPSPTPMDSDEARKVAKKWDDRLKTADATATEILSLPFELLGDVFTDGPSLLTYTIRRLWKCAC